VLGLFICLFLFQFYKNVIYIVGVYLVVADGHVRVYDSEKTYMTAPLSFAEQFTLTKKHTCSAVSRKAYNQNISGGKAVDFYAFYLEQEVEPYGPMR